MVILELRSVRVMLLMLVNIGTSNNLNMDVLFNTACWRMRLSNT